VVTGGRGASHLFNEVVLVYESAMVRRHIPYLTIRLQAFIVLVTGQTV
jgi:hypothetical protein